MRKICLTNDDGAHSIGLLKLAEKLSEHYDLTVIVPETQMSATGKSLTINRPLRVRDNKNADGYRLITHDGTPADSVILAQVFTDKIDIFISGINAGGNTGYHSMLTSGTVGAAFEAALKGYPAIALSMEATPDDWFDPNGSASDYEYACEFALDIIDKILEKGLPDGIDAINMNFPCSVTKDTEIMVTKPTRVRMTNDVEIRVDPHKRKYYWFKGVEQDGRPGEDAYSVLKLNKISISPIVIESIGRDEIELVKSLIE